MKPCLPGLVAEGKLTQDQADRAGSLFDELAQDLRRQFGDQAADAMATDITLRAMQAEASRKRFLAAQTIRTRQRIEADLKSYNGGRGSDGNGGGPIDPRAGPALLGGDGRATYSNVEGRWRAVRGRAHAMMDKILADHHSNLLGQVRNRAELYDIVREVFGEDTGNANARELARAWLQTAEMLRQRRNAAGGDTGKLENWGLPQSHNPRAVRAAGFEAWRAEILPRLDLEKMTDARTGRAFTPESLELVLRDVFETVRSDGWNDRTPGGMGGSSLANQRAQSRFLVFKSADDWMAYADKFGSGTAFDAMMGHIDGMSRDIAMMEILGPNPAHTVQWLKDSLMKAAQTDTAPNSTAIERAKPQIGTIDRMWNELSGNANRPESRTLALGFSSFRSLLTAAKLGGAMLSAVTDTAFQASTRAFNGLRNRTMLGDILKTFVPGSKEDQRLAVRLGLIAEEWANRTAAQQRMFNDELSGEVSRRLAEGLLRTSGLARWTQSGRWAFGMELLGHITDESVKRWGQLDPALRSAMERYGFNEADWDAIRSTPLEEDRGVHWIKPQNIENAALGDRLLEWIARETDHAVPVPDLRTRAIMHSMAPKGTLHGEIIQTAGLFKSFGVSVMLMQARRIMEQAPAGAARYTAGLFIGTTLMGALTIALKDLANGKDPRRMDTPGFWGQATLQGGGWGIFGDFVNSATNREGSGFSETLAGAGVSAAQDVANIVRAKNKSKAAIKAARGMLPGGTLWYARLAFDRMVTDQAMQAVDPDYVHSRARMERYAREQGTQFWWRPGEMGAARAPDFSNAFGKPAEGAAQ